MRVILTIHAIYMPIEYDGFLPSRSWYSYDVYQMNLLALLLLRSVHQLMAMVRLALISDTSAGAFHDPYSRTDSSSRHWWLA